MQKHDLSRELTAAKRGLKRVNNIAAQVIGWITPPVFLPMLIGYKKREKMHGKRLTNNNNFMDCLNCKLFMMLPITLQKSAQQAMVNSL